MKRLRVLSVAIVGACFQYVPPPTVPVRQATAITAPFDSTWSAVITFFAENNVPIRTIEKASGIIVAEPTSVLNRTPILGANGKQKRTAGGGGYLMSSAPIYADCGKISGLPAPDPSSAIYNVRVTGDGTRSTVQVNVRYTGTQLGTKESEPAVCVSTGRFEVDLESFGKRRAEQK